MCGFAGFFNPSFEKNKESYNNILNSMSNAITHRGPDGYGNWFDTDSGIGLTHRRLSIIDISAAGKQPNHLLL